MRHIILAGCLILLGGGDAPAAELPVLRIGYTNQESPFFVMGAGSGIPTLPGVAVEIARMAAERCAVAIEPARYPGGRLLALLENNAIDATLMISFSPERQAIGVYPMMADAADPAFQMATLSYAFYVRRDGGVSWDGETLLGQREPIGANFGWSIVEDLRARGLAVETAQDTQNNFNKLLLKRIDAFAIQTSIGDAYVAKNMLGDQISVLEPAISSKPYYLVFSHAWHDRYRAAADCLWHEIAAIRDRDMPALLARYLDSM